MSVSPVKLVETVAGMLPEHVSAAQSAEIIRHPSAPNEQAKASMSAPPAKARSVWLDRINDFAAAVLPSLVLLTVLLGFWQLACSGEGATLPSPSKIWTESHEVIVHPFKGVTFDMGGMHIQEGGDVGIAGHVRIRYYFAYVIP